MLMYMTSECAFVGCEHLGRGNLLQHFGRAEKSSRPVQQSFCWDMLGEGPSSDCMNLSLLV